MNRWYLLAALAGAPGGIASYYLLRRRDPRTGLRCLYVGMCAGAVHAALNAAAALELLAT